MEPSHITTQRSPLVSVVVPNLNGVGFLSRTLDSLESQTYAHIEVIVVDGASTDGSLELIEAWADRLPLRWVSEPDSGQAEAINKGFCMATGDILGWINSDDLTGSHSKTLVDSLSLT